MWSSNDGWTVERTSPKSKRRRVGNEAEAEAAAGEEVVVTAVCFIIAFILYYGAFILSIY